MLGRSQFAVAISALLAVAAVGCGGSDETTTVTVGATGATGAAGVAGVDEVEEEPRPPRPEPPGPVELVKHFYDLVDARDFQAAWPFLPAAVQSEAGGFEEWRLGHDATVSTDATNVALASQSGDQAVVSLDIEATDVDACTGNDVDQGFAGTWTLSKAKGQWAAEALDIEKVSGGTPTLSRSDCPSSPPSDNGGSGPPDGECTPGYSPCLEPASDYDCASGTGDGPAYTGVVQVTGSDPYDLDGDGDGTGCD